MNTEPDKNQAPGSGLITNHQPLATIFFRSFFIQAGWNYERLQNLGFAFAIMPALRKIYAPGEKLGAAVLRHLGLFNTQPYMAGFVIGNIVRMEEELALMPAGGAGSGTAAFEKKMLEVKAALSSGFAAIGDRIFWGRLKPLTTQLCIVIWALAGFYGWLFTNTVPSVPLPVLFGGPLAGIALYGGGAVYLRWQGLKKGYACGGTASCGLDAVNWPALIRLLSVAGFALSLLIVAGAFGMLIEQNWNGAHKGGLILRAALALGVMVLQRVVRKSGRSIFFAMGLILAASAVVVIFERSGLHL